MKERLTHAATEKKEKAMMAWAASVGMPRVSVVLAHWLAKRQKHTNHRNVQNPVKERSNQSY